MPKKPKISTPLRQVREATGMLQKTFAEFVGIGYDLYQKLEAGRTNMTSRNAAIIFAATGAVPEMLDHEHSKYAGNISHQLYTQESWERWRKGEDRPPKLDYKAKSKQLADWLELLLQAAEATGKLDAVAERICQALIQAHADFGLEGETDTLLNKRPMVISFSHSYGELRKDPELADMRGFKDKKYREGKIICDDEIEVFPVPIMAMPFNPRSELQPVWVNKPGLKQWPKKGRGRPNSLAPKY